MKTYISIILLILLIALSLFDVLTATSYFALLSLCAIPFLVYFLLLEVKKVMRHD